MTSQDTSKLSAAKQALLAKRLRGKSVKSTEEETGGIPKRSTTDPVPLSFAQQRLWFLDQLEGGQTASYNMPFVWSLDGDLNLDALKQSVQAIISRHEALRTTFALVDGQPKQVVAPALTIDMPVLDLCEYAENERQEQAKRLTEEEINRPFDLEQGPLLRTLLLRLQEREHVLVLNMHHIVSDGWSMGVFFNELIALYNAFAQGLPSSLPELTIQYPDFALWQRQWLQGEVLEKQLNYWKQHLEGTLPILQLPTDRTPANTRSTHGSEQMFKLSPALTAGLKALSQREGATLFMTLLAVFKTLLYRYSGQDDILVGTPIAGRTRRDIEGLIGFFVNTLVLRTDLSGGPTFRQVLERVRNVSLQAYAHQEVPFEKLVEELQPDRDSSQSPLFRVMFALMNAPMGDLELSGVKVKTVNAESHTAKFDLSVLLIEEGDGLTGAIEFRTDLFDASTIKRMAGHFEQVLHSVVANPDQSIDDVELLPDAERHLLLHEWNQTALDYPRDLCAHQLFEHWAAATPERTALVAGDLTLSYGELNARANQVAHTLQKMGVGPDSLVGLCMRRSAELLIGMLGILKAGGAYVPIDPNFPAERIGFTMEDAQVVVFLTQADLQLDIPPHDAQVLYIDANWTEIAEESTQNPARTVQAHHLAYVTYTSGSTGRPKGVAVEHRNAVALAYWARDVYQPQDWACALFGSSICFDASVYDLFLTWDRGGKLIMVENVLYLPELQERNEVTLISTVPSAMAELVRMNALPPSVRIVNLGGEPLPSHLAQKIYQTSNVTKVFNVYGPSETTCISTYNLVEKGTDKPMTIGRPLANEQVYVLDPSLRPVPIGVPGELYIAGDGVARGYLNRPELTDERFLTNPFRPEVGARMYRTGDLVRYLPDGQIEFLARIDTQVKIRGQRVEMGEIEAVLAAHPDVQEVVVDARPDHTGAKQLVAYLIPEEKHTPSPEILRQWVRGQLPEYMVPAVFMMLDSFPLTATGKVERKALPTPEGQQVLTDTYAPPRSAQTLAMVRTWEEILGKRPIGVFDNFFSVGGDSLKAVALMSAIDKRFGVRLPLETIFKATTVTELCEHLTGGDDFAANEGPILLQQGNGSASPLFLVHPSGGGVLCYAALASALGAEETVYGLQAVGFASDEEALTDVHQLADRYLQEIKRVQSEGSYRLAGWSFGGVVAYEMARRLEQLGDGVEFLAMIDTPALEGETEVVPEWDSQRLLTEYAQEVIGLNDCDLTSLEEEAAFEYVLQRAVERKALPQSATVEMIRLEIKMLAAHAQAMATYTCQEPIGTDLHLFTVSEQAQGQELVDPKRWQTRTTGALILHSIPGDHFSLIQPPHVFALAAAMKQAEAARVRV